MTKYSRKTMDILVVVEPRYEKDRSTPKESEFVFSYAVSIRNEGKEPLQIHRRSWVITDAFYNVEHVEGEGVVGEQPVILPGQTFAYVSFCPLKTSFGTMHGHYHAITSKGDIITIEIPEIILAHPFAVQ